MDVCFLSIHLVESLQIFNCNSLFLLHFHVFCFNFTAFRRHYYYVRAAFNNVDVHNRMSCSSFLMKVLMIGLECPGSFIPNGMLTSLSCSYHDCYIMVVFFFYEITIVQQYNSSIFHI